MSDSLIDDRNSTIPLVSIGIPTYNRVSSLKRAIESALAQDYPNLELVISDNASTDETESLCKEFCDRDNRIRYVRQETNQGAAKNFTEVLKQSRGKFFMWLADDDWLDPSYISQCVKVLIEQPEYSLVCGKAKYFENGEVIFEGLKINLLQDIREDRVLAYYTEVIDNGTFYGLMYRNHLANIPFQDTLAPDWLLIAEISFIGKIKTLDSVAINRSYRSIPENDRSLASQFRLSKFQQNTPYLSIAIAVFKESFRMSLVYDSTNKLMRWIFPFRAFMIIFFRFTIHELYYKLGGKLILRTRLKRVIQMLKKNGILK